MQSRSSMATGVLAASTDGLLLALWSVATKMLGNTHPNFLAYPLVIFCAGLCYLFLTLLPKKSTRKVKGDRSLFLILMIFGAISILQFSIGIFIFEYQTAEVSISAFLRNSSLIFAALICHFAWLYPNFCTQSNLTPRVLLGVLIFMFASWLFVGFPIGANDWKAALTAWGLLSILIGFNRALTEIMTQKFNQASNAYTMNLVLGTFFLIVATPLIVLSVFKGDRLSLDQFVWILLVACIIPAMQAFRFYAYNHLKDVLGKKGIGIWSYLLFSFVLASFFLSEPLKGEKLIALVIGLFAVLLLEEGFYNSLISNRLRLLLRTHRNV